VERVVGDGLGVEAGGDVGRHPDGHPPAVEDERERVEADTDRCHLHARHPPVGAQEQEQQQVGADEGPCQRQVLADGLLPQQHRPDPEGKGDGQDPDPA